MRVLVAAGPMGSLVAHDAATAIAAGWADHAQVAVVPFGTAAAGCLEAFSALHDVDMAPVDLPSGLAAAAWCGDTCFIAPTGDPAARVDRDADSGIVGEAIAEASAQRARRIIVDLGACVSHDGGAGLWRAAQKARVVDDGVELIGIVPEAETGVELVGLRGVTARRGQRDGWDPADMLRIDAELDAFSRQVAPELTQTGGAGACGGAGFGVLALGGRLSGGVDFLAGEADLEPTLNLADLVVVGTAAFDFAERGGAVVTELADRATAHGTACIVVAGHVVISSREMRTFGVEAAYSTDVGSMAALADSAARIARSWKW